MKHLIICREYPPAPAGGIGTYADNVSRLLVAAGETVHVIAQRWRGAEKPLEEYLQGKLVVHRLPFTHWKSLFGAKASPGMQSETARDLFKSAFPPLSFSWQASLLAERLIETEGIDTVEAQDYEAPLY